MALIAIIAEGADVAPSGMSSGASAEAIVLGARSADTSIASSRRTPGLVIVSHPWDSGAMLLGGLDHAPPRRGAPGRRGVG